MTAWIEVKVTIDDSTPSQATLVVKDSVETRTFAYDDDLRTLTPALSELDYNNTTGGELVRAMDIALAQIFNAKSAISAQPDVPQEAGHEIWTLAELDYTLSQTEPINGDESIIAYISTSVEATTGPYSATDIVKWDLTVVNDTGFTLSHVRNEIGTVEDGQDLLTPQIILESDILDGTTAVVQVAWEYPSGTGPFAVYGSVVLSNGNQEIPLEFAVEAA